MELGLGIAGSDSYRLQGVRAGNFPFSDQAARGVDMKMGDREETRAGNGTTCLI